MSENDEITYPNEPDQPMEASEVSETPTAEPEHRSNLKKAAGSAGAVALLLFKFKGLLLLGLGKLKFLLVGFKFLKLGKILTTGGSMVLTVVIDAMRWGWAFAIGFVMLLFVHEMGHALMIKARGMKAGAPVFIPGFGAFIALKDMPHDAKTEAEIGIAGPVLGSVAAFACLYIGKMAHLELFTRLAYVGFMINLFNLLPVLPLDGGRVMAAISPKVWLVGLALTVAAFIWSHNPIFLILVLMSVGRMWHGIKTKPEDMDYYNVPKETRLQMTIAYFGLAAVLGFFMMELHHR